MRAVVFGTAGHIDHGKTMLVKALTGIDCDRLPEEKRRGITLVLGFAPLADPNGETEISFIDVPGHEKLVHTMIAGAAGIDRALLVVAADEGIMPQTREHLTILDLLGVRGGVVAVTKADLVDAGFLARRRTELADALAGGPLAGAPVIACSATSGLGLESVKTAVLACAREVVRGESADRPFRMAVDRAFSAAGAGTVVTGTAHWGTVRSGDELVSLPRRRTVRVRGVQVHGHSRDAGAAGERVALRLAGVAVAELPRGEQLLSTGPWQASCRLALDLRLLGSGSTLAEGEKVWLHLLAARVVAKIERLHPAPLETGMRGRALLRLARGVFAAPGDRVVLRRLSPVGTLGGGTVLDVAPPRLRRRDAPRLMEWEQPWPDAAAALARWIADAGPAGTSVEDLAARLGLLPAGLEPVLGRLLAADTIAMARAAPPIVVHRDAVAPVLERGARLVAEAGSVGLPLAELVARVVPPAARRIRDYYLAALRRSGTIREVGGRVLAASLDPLEEPLAAAVEELYRRAGFEAPSPAQVAATLHQAPATVDGVVRFLLDGKRLIRIGGKWILHRKVVDDVVASLRSWGVGTFDVAQFKARFGLTRKLAIPLLEWLDSARVTRREGERRRLLPPPAGTPPGA